MKILTNNYKIRHLSTMLNFTESAPVAVDVNMLAKRPINVYDGFVGVVESVLGSNTLVVVETPVIFETDKFNKSKGYSVGLALTYVLEWEPAQPNDLIFGYCMNVNSNDVTIQSVSTSHLMTSPTSAPTTLTAPIPTPNWAAASFSPSFVTVPITVKSAASQKLNSKIELTPSVSSDKPGHCRACGEYNAYQDQPFLCWTCKNIWDKK